MEKRKTLQSGAKWEDLVGYSRAVKIGNLLEVSGTVASESGEALYKDDAYQQTRFILEKIQNAMSQLGCSLSDTIRTRIYVTDISRWEEIGKAHAEFFGSIRPVTTMVEVARLIHPDYLVEIEATAYLPE